MKKKKPFCTLKWNFFVKGMKKVWRVTRKVLKGKFDFCVGWKAELLIFGDDFIQKIYTVAI